MLSACVYVAKGEVHQIFGEQVKLVLERLDFFTPRLREDLGNLADPNEATLNCNR